MQVILDRMQVIKVEIYEGRDNIALPLCNIIYITPEGKYCKIVTIKGEYIATKSFKEIKEHLTAKDFCECHGSYYVNLNYVEKYSNTEVYLKYKSHEYKVHMSDGFILFSKNECLLWEAKKYDRQNRYDYSDCIIMFGIHILYEFDNAAKKKLYYV